MLTEWKRTFRIPSTEKRFKTDKGSNKGSGQKKSPETLEVSGLSMAAGEGFEPSHTESESAVLPLHKPAISYSPQRTDIIIQKSGKLSIGFPKLF